MSTPALRATSAAQRTPAWPRGRPPRSYQPPGLVAAVAIAIDLLCWTRLLLLEGPLADAEPKTLRYRLLHTAARIIKRARKQILRIPQTWPWATN